MNRRESAEGIVVGRTWSCEGPNRRATGKGEGDESIVAAWRETSLRWLTSRGVVRS